ncbi:MAG: aminoacyl-histidine dipeptidase [Bacteroidales bacterium]|nr:aminoacyl-histidine dipeptidase [Bacteroidales bacterium]
MSKEITNLDPKKLWENFYKLTQIPRPSKKEGKIIQFMREFGENLGLETIVDEVGNVIIMKPATSGMENRKTVVLQGHLDMVPQKNSDKTFDFEIDPIEPFVEDGWVTADGTTLGADNGIGVAAAMSILESDDLQHGPIEALFTIDEETGMTGAFGLKADVLDGDILINMDSEDEGELYVGCAGGTNGNMKISFIEENVPDGHKAFKLELSGLKGGHSGIDIPLEKGNSNKLLNRYMWHAAKKHGLRIGEIDGGSLRNAIPRESFAIVTVPAAGEKEFLECVKEYDKIFKNEFLSIDPGIKLEAKPAEIPESVMDKVSQDKLLNAVYACPNGVVRMSTDMEGLVETSTNLAVIKTEGNEVKIQCLMRSSVDTAKEDLKNMFTSVFEPVGIDIVFEGEYPGWKPNMDSAILKTMQDVYNKKFGKIPEIKAIHAGLECGLLGGVYPNMDMISFGPTIRYPHSPDEKVNIETVSKFWEFLLETLKAIPVK